MLFLIPVKNFYPYSNEYDYYYLFKPVRSIQRRIDELVAFFTKNIIGIHIRRTDNKKAKEISKIELFISAMTKTLIENPLTEFYLSTDDLSVENLIKNEFGHLVHTLKNKDLDRSSNKGIEDAVVDLYCLSKTNRILGSYWSSFSGVAAWINGIPLEIIQ